VLLAALCLVELGAAAGEGAGPEVAGPPPYDPLAHALASAGKVGNLEATVPPQCYTRTEGRFNPCWTCHTVPRDPNFKADWRLQKEYAFSPFARTNRWTNLFRDRTAELATISDGEIERWIRDDNYTPLRGRLEGDPRYPGYVPDLDLSQGFDDDGMARDGSGWRAIRFKPFPGTFWPTNGSADDVFIRLPAEFRRTAAGEASREVYRINLAILEAAVAADPDRPLEREVEPIDERAAGLELDGDGRVEGSIRRIRRLPKHYAGGASGVEVHRYLFPAGTEFLHTVRYLDPDAPTLLSARMKEVRYARKVEFLDLWALLRAEEEEAEEKDEGRAPFFRGTAVVGLRNATGWQLQGFIEDAEGRLRLQTDEELRACMGCHGGLGVTVDSTFTLPRKVPGAAGWRPQDLRGIPDAPQAGHREGEILAYLRRAGAADEFRANAEMTARLFRDGALDEAALRRAAPGGDRDLADLLAPSRQRALLLDKAYLVLVREQSFVRGRDPVLGRVETVHAEIHSAATGLEEAKRLFTDGKLWLDW
jgi:hypothetical protein